MDAFQKANTGVTVKINTVDHNTFQENINNYLQGQPDDVFTWFAGYRMRFFAPRAWPATSPTSGATQRDGRRAQEGLHRRRRQAVLHAIDLLPVGAVLPQERLGGEGIHRAQDPRRAQGPRREDEEGRPHPDRLRRQGRLARDGHLRPDQHAGQRLRLPHQPDGRRRGMERPRGQEDLRHLGGSAPDPPDRQPRPHLAGGRPGLQKKKSGMYLLGMFLAQQFRRAPSRTTWTSSPSRRSTRPSEPTPSRRRSTAT